MKKITIAVVTGGNSAEVGIALKGASIVQDALNPGRFEVYKVIIDGANWFVDSASKDIPINKDDFSFMIGDRSIRFDGAFVVIHGDPAENGKLQGYFDMIHLPYTCCDVLTSALTFDKSSCKDFLSAYDVPMAGSIRFRKGEDHKAISKKVAAELTLPVFIKPNREGSSYGVSKVHTTAEIAPAIHKSLEFDDEVIIEEFIDGREITGGVITRNGKIVPLPLTEILSKNEFFDYNAKYEGESEEITPAELSPELTKKCHRLSTFIYEKLNCRGMVRVDYILKGETFYFLEVNTIPGLSAESIVPQQAAAMGMSLSELFENVISETLKHNT